MEENERDEVGDPTHSARNFSDVSVVSRTIIERILKQHKLHPFKIRLVQEVNNDDFDRRLQFCEVITEVKNNNQNYMFDIFFSNEFILTLTALSIDISVGTDQMRTQK